MLKSNLPYTPSPDQIWLQKLVTPPGQYLDAEAPLVHQLPVSFTAISLESLETETKYTDSKIMVQLVSSHRIK